MIQDSNWIERVLEDVEDERRPSRQNFPFQRWRRRWRDCAMLPLVF